MSVTLTDSRAFSIEDAPRLMQEIALCECRIAQAKAKFEDQIARRKAAYEAEIADDAAERDGAARVLAAIILANKDAFAKPRSRKTDFGRFGLRDVSDVQVTAQDELTDWALTNGHFDVVQVRRIIVKKAVRKRIEDGQTVPGAFVERGERAFYKVDKALLEAAAEGTK